MSLLLAAAKLVVLLDRANSFVVDEVTSPADVLRTQGLVTSSTTILVQLSTISRFLTVHPSHPKAIVINGLT